LGVTRITAHRWAVLYGVIRGAANMTTAIKYQMPVPTDTALLGELTVKKHEGQYEINLSPLTEITDRSVFEKLSSTLRQLESELNATK
jgi:hypothetical protein